jgi:hypothetical protein
LYAKSDGWYDQDDGGTETKIGSGGSGLPDTFEGTAGEALSQYDVVYANSADSGELWIATNGGTSAQADAIGIVTESGGISDTATGTVTRFGPITYASWSWTPGATLWLGTDGAMTETMPSAGDYAKPLGYAETATKIWFAPQNGWLVGYDIDLTEIPAENDGRITLVSTTQIKWDGHRITLWDPTKGRDVQVIPSSVPTLDYDDTDLDSNALVAAYPFDLFAEFSSATAFTIVAKKWTNATTRAVTPALWHGRLRYDNTTDAGKKRLFLGTVYLDTGPIFVNSKSLRYISNFYNTKLVTIGHATPYSSNTSATVGAWMPWIASSSMAWASQYVLCEPRNIRLVCSGPYNTSTTVDASCGISLDSVSTPTAYGTGVAYYATPISEFNSEVAIGYHYQVPMVFGSAAATCYWWLSSAEMKAFFEGEMMA